jgi:hypothetical protein
MIKQPTDAIRDPANSSAQILGGRTRHGWFVYASERPEAPIPADLASTPGKGLRVHLARL